MPKLTYEALVKVNACKQREEFHRIAGEGIELTPAIAAQYAEHFELPSMVIKLLDREHLRNMYRELAQNAKRFTTRECREFKVFYAQLAAKHYAEQLNGKL